MRAIADRQKMEEPTDKPFRHPRRAFFSRFLLAASASWLLPQAVERVLRHRVSREQARVSPAVKVRINPLAVPRGPDDSTLNG